MQKPLSTLNIIFLLVFGLLVWVTACTSVPETPQEDVTLRIAVLPILDTLPMYVAQESGYFQENGVKVEFIPVQSAPERVQVLAAKQADGTVNEVLSALFFNREDIQMKVVRYARVATPDHPVFRILAAQNSGIKNIADLNSVEIGVSEGTVIEYLTDRLLEAEGFSPEMINTVSVPKIDLRLSLLTSGELKAAMLPDPLSSLAIQSGASVILDDSKHPEFGFSVYSFRKEVIDANPQAIRGFLAAIEKAVLEINQNPNQWNTVLSDRKLVPQPLLGEYQVPPFPTEGVPSEAQFNDIVEWARAKGLISGEYDYTETITPIYLPQG